MMEKAVYTSGLGAGYGKKAVISGIEISAERGKITALIGPNGAGKSTILKTLTRQLAPVSGTVFIDGNELSKITPHELAKKMSILMTERINPELMTCYDVAAAGRYPYTDRLGFLSVHDRECIDEAMRLTSSENLADREFSRISDGQRQRVMLARAICQEPEIMVLDEPTSFLDIHHKLELLNILRRLAEERNVAVIMSMHEIDLAQRISDRVICVGENGIEKMGTPEEIFTAEYISALYGIASGKYESAYGSAELVAPKGEPRVFVIAGGGSGAEVFRQLQRKNIPFAAGIIHENDIDLPAARALAAEVITEKAFEPVSRENIEKAKQLIDRCGYVICCVKNFGTMNEGCRELEEYSQDKLTIIEKL